MTKELKPESLTLSRFFHVDIKTTKSENGIVDSNKSPYFTNNANKETHERDSIKTKRKRMGPQFRGFTKEDKEKSEVDKDKMELLLEGMKDSVDESNNFTGYSEDEFDQSSKLCENFRKKLTDFENNIYNIFPGFSQLEQNNSVKNISQILDKYVSIRSDIYKNIDRRVLTYHLEEEENREKLVCSKYWVKKENGSVKSEDSGDYKMKNVLKMGKAAKCLDFGSSPSDNKNCKKDLIKLDTFKAEMRDLKLEDDLVLELHKLREELRELRASKPLSPTKENKPEYAPFLQIKKELIMPSFIPPKSPHNLIEEDLYHDPWALLISTIFLNKTAGRSARPYIFWFLDENPDPLLVIGKKVEQLETYFGALGLQKTRACQVWRMSHDFIYKKWRRVSELYGIGRYGEEAFRLFCLGDFSFEPKDRYLRIYKAWYEMQERNDRIMEMNS